MHRMLFLPLLGLSACTSTSSGTLADNAVVSGSSWVALDLASGAVEPVAGIPDTSDPRWRETQILFRQVAPGDAPIGRAVADLLTEADEQPRRQVAHGRFWIAVHELTQAQWLRLAGTRPWYQVLPVADLGPWTAPDQPAFGLSADAIEPVLAAWDRDGWKLDLPEGDEWECACLAGSTSKFSWGDTLDATLVAASAVCDTTQPASVGGRAANAWGLHDMHGNVWELVRDGTGYALRGGAWDQPAVTARASNRLPVAAEDVGWNVGVRLVLRR